MRFRDMRGAREIKIDSHAICDSFYQRNAICVLDLVEECMSGHCVDMATHEEKHKMYSGSEFQSPSIIELRVSRIYHLSISGMFQLRAQSIKSYGRWSTKSRILSSNGPSQTDVLRSTAHIPLLSME